MLVLTCPAFIHSWLTSLPSSLRFQKLCSSLYNVLSRDCSSLSTEYNPLPVQLSLGFDVDDITRSVLCPKHYSFRDSVLDLGVILGQQLLAHQPAQSLLLISSYIRLLVEKPRNYRTHLRL